MHDVAFILGVILLVLVIGGPICSIIVLVKHRRVRARLQALEDEVRLLRTRPPTEQERPDVPIEEEIAVEPTPAETAAPPLPLSTSHRALRLVPPASPARGTASPCVQPVVELAPEGTGLFARIDRQAWAPLSQPDPGHHRSGELEPACSTTRSSWPSTTTSWPTSTPTWPTAPSTGSSGIRRHPAGPIAYFCAEYGCPRIAGHLLGRPGRPRRRPHEDRQRHGPPVLGVGLHLSPRLLPPASDADGHQEHATPTTTSPGCRSAASQDRDGLPLTVSVPLPGRDLPVAVWTVAVGRVPVLLLDTDIPENADDTARSPTSSTSAVARCGCTRSSSWASGVFARPCLGLAPARSGTSTRVTRRCSGRAGPRVRRRGNRPR